MKLIKVSTGDVQYQPKTKQQATAVFNHLLKEYEKFDKDLREMSELVHLIQGSNKDARQQLAKKMVGMADSMSGTWKGVVSEFNKL